MKKIFTFFLALVASVSAIYASDTPVGGIWYKFNHSKRTASVTYRGDSYNSYSNAYSGSVVIPSSVTYQGATYSVTSIGEWAFYDCSSLTSVTIGNSVTSIGDYAFNGCSKLTSVTIPNSVTSIGNYAFARCSSLTSVTIPESVTSIGYRAFYGCSSLTSVYNAHCFAYMPTSYSGAYTIPEGIEQIASSAFYGCSSLTSVTIGNSVTSIGDYAFYGCSGLISVTIGESVTSIGDAAFEDCSSLTSITCEAATPPTIGGTYTFGDTYTFDGVSKSIPVYVPCECVEAYKAANGWKDFTNIQEPLADYSIEVYVNDTIMGTAIVNYNTFCEGAQISATPNFGYHFVQWSDGNTENPRTLELTQDTTLTAEFAQSFSGQCGDSLYWELVDTTLHITGEGEMYDYKPDSAPWKVLVSSIKVLTIAEDVTKLSQSFGSCSVLESIVWNAKHAADAYSDGQYVVYPIFYGIRSQIKSFTLGENVEYIPTYLCTGMDKLTSMTIPNSVTSIGKGAFKDCSSLTSITIPESVTSIGQAAFYQCTSMTSVTIPNSVTSIGNSAFRYCSSLTSVTIPNSVTSIGDYAFSGCSSLTSMTIPNSVTSIGEGAFKDCSSLTSITIPNSVTSIGGGAFEGCSSLTSITIPNSVTSIGGGAFWGCTSLTSVTIPNSVTSIGGSAFYGCSSLTSITIPNSVTSIGSSAFEGCKSLTSVTIPESVTSIGNSAFEGCKSLTSVTIPESVTSIGHAAFYQCTSMTSVTIPESVTSIGSSAFYGCSSLTSVTIPESVTSIGSSAFGGCKGLTSVIIPDNVTYIGESAFAGCSNLDTITIGNGVKQIENHAFYNCSSLAYVICKATKIPSTATDAFNLSIINAFPSATLYVPKASLNKYKSTAPWKYFNLILPIEDSGDDPSNPDDEEDVGALTCAEAVAICQETGTTITTEQYTIRGYVTEIKTAYSEQYNNITFWMADTPHGGKVLQAYRVIPVEANDIDVKVGDYVEVIGSLVNYYGTTPEVYTGGIYTILPKQEENGSTTEEEYITACDSYEWHGETYTESGDYTYTTTTENGCEHVEILHLTIYKSEYVETSITACDSYEWHGETYTESGDYTYTTTTENGCERVEILHLMITPSNPEDNSKDSITVKAKIPAHWTDDINAWIWGATSSGHWVTPTKEDDWYVVTEDVEELNIIFVNGTNWSGYKNQTIDMTFTANACIQLAQEGSAKATYTAIDCESNDTPKDDEEDDGLITCAEAVAICQETGTTITTEQYTIRGYVTEIKTAYSEQYNNITFWMADIPNGGKVLQAYRVIPVEANDIDVKVGDYVEAVGTLVNYGGTTPEINAGGTYTILTTTAVENTNTQSSMTNCQKIIRNGQLIIIRDGVEYNAMGQEM